MNKAERMVTVYEKFGSNGFLKLYTEKELKMVEQYIETQTAEYQQRLDKELPY